MATGGDSGAGDRPSGDVDRTDSAAPTGVLRQGPDSVDLVLVEPDPADRAGLARQFARLAVAASGLGAVLALVGALCTVLVLLICGGGLSVGPILTVMAVVFGAGLVVMARAELVGTRRIELRPPRAPTEVRLISRLGAVTEPITHLHRVTLSHDARLSESYPFTASSGGVVDVVLHLADRAVKAGSVRADADILADELRALLSPAGVGVDVEARYPPSCDPDVVDDHLPADGIVVEIMKRRPAGDDAFRPRPGYLAGQEAQAAWPMVWWVQKVAEANGVRMKWSGTSSFGRSYGWADFRAVDVQRVADEIAAGTAVLDPAWRNDTEVGKAAHASFRAEHEKGR